MRGEPGADGAFGNIDVKTLADQALRFAYGIAEIVRGDGFENNPRCTCPAFPAAVVNLRRHSLHWKSWRTR